MRGAQEHNTKREKKTAAQNSSRVHCATKISRVHLPWKNTKVLSSRHSVHVKENERNGQDYQKYALFVPFLRLFFSPSLSLFCSRVALSSRSYSFSLSFQNAFVCAFVRACLCVSSGLIFVSEFCFHLNHKFSSRALTYWRFLSLSSHHLFIQFAASAPATSADRPWPWSLWSARTSR